MTSAQRLRLVVALGTVNLLLVTVVLGFEFTGALPSERSAALANVASPIAEIVEPGRPSGSATVRPGRPAGPTSNPVVVVPVEPATSPEVGPTESLAPEPTPTPTPTPPPVVGEATVAEVALTVEGSPAQPGPDSASKSDAPARTAAPARPPPTPRATARPATSTCVRVGKAAPHKTPLCRPAKVHPPKPAKTPKPEPAKTAKPVPPKTPEPRTPDKTRAPTTAGTRDEDARGVDPQRGVVRSAAN